MKYYTFKQNSQLWVGGENRFRMREDLPQKSIGLKPKISRLR